VHKYGGSSVADIESIQRVARQVVDVATKGYAMVVVVSAMGKTTNVLLQMAQQIDPEPPRRELDMLLTVGERISMSLLSMAINKLGWEAISFTGSQSGILTTDSHSNARVIEVRPFRLQDELENGKIVIVAGFQGMSYKREITTLGRGGSDTTAIALAAALDAERVEIYSDVDGVYSADPRIVPEAYRLDEADTDEMMFLSKAGAKVMAADAMEYARKKNIAVWAKSTFSPQSPGTVIRKNPARDDRQFTAVTGKKDVVYVQFRKSAAAAEASDLFECLNAVGEHQVLPFMSHVSFQGNVGATFLYSLADLHLREVFERRLRERFGPAIEIRGDIGTVTLVGAGIAEDRETHPRITAFLHEHKELVHQVFFAPLGVTMLTNVSDVDHLVKDTHALFLAGKERGGQANGK
jgi:aspartate kinase